MIITTKAERATLLEAGKRLAFVVDELKKKVAPGVTTLELDDLAESLIRDGGDTPALIGYTPEGASRPFPATLCVAVNDEVVHGIPNEVPRTLKEGDIIGLDLVLEHKGVFVDMATTVPVGKPRKEDVALMRATEEALAAGIAVAKAGARMGDISSAIEKVLKSGGYGIVKVLGGHGVGGAVHEDPHVPNYGKAGTGPELVEGMVLALEPIATAGKGSVTLRPDGYTYVTRDGSRASHHEHTILIEKGGATVVTEL